MSVTSSQRVILEQNNINHNSDININNFDGHHSAGEIENEEDENNNNNNENVVFDDEDEDGQTLQNTTVDTLDEKTELVQNNNNSNKTPKHKKEFPYNYLNGYFASEETDQNAHHYSFQVQNQNQQQLQQNHQIEVTNHQLDTSNIQVLPKIPSHTSTSSLNDENVLNFQANSENSYNNNNTTGMVLPGPPMMEPSQEENNNNTNSNIFYGVES